MGKIISVSNQKGGVGKTTTAINLSAGLAEHGWKILLIDADGQGNSTSGLGINRDKITFGLHEALIDGFPLSEIVLETGYDNFHILTSSKDYSGIDVGLYGVNGREQRLKDGLLLLKEEYDYIFIDCPPSLTLMTVNALTAADSILIPIQTEYYALEGLGQLLGAVNLIRLGLNPELTIEGILLTMYDKRTRLGNQVVQDVRDFFRGREYVFDTIVPRNVRLSEAPSYGKPALYYDASCPGAQAYRALSKEFLTQQNRILSLC